MVRQHGDDPKPLYGMYLLRGDHVIDIQLFNKDRELEMITQFFKLDTNSKIQFWATKPYDKWIHSTKDIRVKIVQ